MPGRGWERTIHKRRFLSNGLFFGFECYRDFATIDDVVYERNGERFSFDTTLAKEESKFILVKGGWKKDYCAICRWELFETDDATHGTVYSNGKEWVCEECYQRFLAGDYFGSAYSDIT